MRVNEMTRVRACGPVARGWTRSGALVALTLGCSGTPVVTSDPEITSNFTHVEHGRVVDASGASLWLRGVAFGDWLDDSAEPPREMHDERDYERVAAMGMNTVRLAVTDRVLEDPDAPGTVKERGFAWIDDNVEWARKTGIHLLLSVGTYYDLADECQQEFWSSPELQDRYAGIWQALAERYADETVIAGYVPVDFPVPAGPLDQWQRLADRLTSAIREKDPHHMLILGRANAIACTYDLSAAETFVPVADDNVVYEFERQKPWPYVAQLVEAYGLPAFGAYPDDTNITVSLSPGGPATWLHGSWDSRPGADALFLTPEETTWTRKRFYYTVTDPKFRIGTLSLQSDFNTGTVYFDDVVVRELDEDGNLVRTILDLDLEGKSSWYLWQGSPDGTEIEGTGVLGVGADGHRGKSSVTVSGTTSLANLSDQTLAFLVRAGRTYEVTSWMKGESSSPTGESMVRLDFWDYEGNFGAFDKQSISTLFDDFVAWGKAEGVPLNVQAYGPGAPSFEEGRGGLEFVSDYIDLMIERQLHFTYVAYHMKDFGIYGNEQGLPDPDAVNQELVDLLTAKHH